MTKLTGEVSLKHND